MEPGIMLALRDLAEEVNDNRSNFRKWVIKQYGKDSVTKIRCPKGSGSQVLAVTDELAEVIRADRLLWKGDRSAPSDRSKDPNAGVFYALLLAPDLSEKRMKFGFTDSVPSRESQHRTTCPTLRTIRTWSCSRCVEQAALKVVDANAIQVGGEVYDVDDWELVMGKLDQFFDLMN